jgi:hypothetical protein
VIEGMKRLCVEKMGLDIDKIKVKKDTKDAQQKAH